MFAPLLTESVQPQNWTLVQQTFVQQGHDAAAGPIPAHPTVNP
jgi:hypothetical protein